MKIKFGKHEIDVNKISKVYNYSEGIACIRFKTGNSRLVFLNKKFPSPSRLHYDGDYEQLKKLIELLKK